MEGPWALSNKFCPYRKFLENIFDKNIVFFTFVCLSEDCKSIQGAIEVQHIGGPREGLVDMILKSKMQKLQFINLSMMRKILPNLRRKYPLLKVLSKI